MPYQINKFNGDPLVVLQDGTLDSTTDIGLVGKNFAGYGEIQNENFLWILENFAGESAPGKPILGQLWYDSNSKKIKVYTGVWELIGNTKLSAEPPTQPVAGDLWLQTTTNKFYVYNGTVWNFIGPETVIGFPNTRMISDRVREKASMVFYPIIKASLNDTVVAIFSERDFEISDEDAVPGFTVLRKGITLSSTSLISGDLVGNASSATRLVNPRFINDVLFDATSNISIRAPSPFPLVPGAHINGQTYSGDESITWSVIANSSNVDNTIVRRDANGSFYASTIYSDIVGSITAPSGFAVFGNVQGNVTGNVQGNVTGNVQGNVTGNVTGNLQGTTTGPHIGSVTGNVIGNVIGDVTGNLSGVALAAQRLTTVRTINGIGFDGTQSITVFDNTKLALTGGSLTGLLTLSANPTQNLHAATKQYVDNKVVGLATTSSVNTSIANAQRVKAWVVFNGSNGTIKSNLNVTSVTRVSTGRYRIDIESGVFSNGNFAVAGMASDTDHFVTYLSSTATQLDIYTIDNGDPNNRAQYTSGDVRVIMVG